MEKKGKKMNIILWSVEKLIPYGNNAKKHDEKQVKNVANSIKRFGWQQPLVIDKNGVIVIGHCRLMAAQMLGLEKVPVTIADDLTEDEINELRIVDNLTNESPWDFEQLKKDIKGLQFDGFDFGLEHLWGNSEGENESINKNEPIEGYICPRCGCVFTEEQNECGVV